VCWWANVMPKSTVYLVVIRARSLPSYTVLLCIRTSRAEQSRSYPH
jgi:hypothetical protein